jgi:hypothetical protein
MHRSLHDFGASRFFGGVGAAGGKNYCKKVLLRLVTYSFGNKNARITRMAS